MADLVKLILVCSLLVVCGGLSCLPCTKTICEISHNSDGPKCHEVLNVVCPEVCPECEKVMDSCGCCPVCAGQEGESCSKDSRACAEGLKCTGLDNGFGGTCQPKPLSQKP